MNAFDDLALGSLDQICDVMVLALQAHGLVLDGVGDQRFAQALQIEACLDAIGHLVFHVQHPALQGTGRGMQDALVLHHHVIGRAATDVDDGDRHGNPVGIERDALAVFDDHVVIPGGQCLRDHLVEGDAGRQVHWIAVEPPA